MCPCIQSQSSDKVTLETDDPEFKVNMSYQVRACVKKEKEKEKVGVRNFNLASSVSFMPYP